MKEFVVEIGARMVKIKAGTPRIAVAHALDNDPNFGLSYNGGKDRQLGKGERLTIQVRNRKDCSAVRFTDES